MRNKLQRKDYFYIGSMLFGILFGAGNLIFPVSMGQKAGSAFGPATVGFLISAIGLPFLGIIAMGVSESRSVYELSSRMGKRFGFAFTLMLYLALGPFFAMPRLATTSFSIGLAPFMTGDNQGTALMIYSLIFFIATWFLSQNPSKLIDYVGKFLNPIFLTVLGILLLLVVVNPIGDVTTTPVQEAYQNGALFQGILDGYGTLDVLAALAFGILVVSALKGLGVTEPKQITRDMIKSGTISVILMGVIYTLLVYAGTTSVAKLSISENGGVALAQISQHYLGSSGSMLLALIVFFGCLKTSVGLATAVTEEFHTLFPKMSYKSILLVVVIFPALFANVGLTNIIKYSIPVLYFLYPLAIVLVLLTLADKLFKGKRSVYRYAAYFTLVAALLDGLGASSLSEAPIGKFLLGIAKTILPFFSLGMGWVVPAIIGVAVGLLIPENE